jgi:hypothetical protein
VRPVVEVGEGLVPRSIQLGEEDVGDGQSDEEVRDFEDAGHSEPRREESRDAENGPVRPLADGEDVAALDGEAGHVLLPIAHEEALAPLPAAEHEDTFERRSGEEKNGWGTCVRCRAMSHLRLMRAGGGVLPS